MRPEVRPVVLLLYFASICGSVNCSAFKPEASDIELVNKINTALNQISTEEYYLSTLFASDDSLFRDILLKKEETQFLIKHAALAVPLMIERLKTGEIRRLQETSKQSYALSQYFLVFLMTPNASVEVLPYLADYLKSLPESEKLLHGGGDWIIFKGIGDPFMYAIEAVEAIMEMTMSPRFGDRFDVADKAMEWFEGHTRKQKD